MLSVSPANNILIIHSLGNMYEFYQPSVKVEVSPLLCSHVVPFSLSLVKKVVKCSQIDSDQLTWEAWWMSTSHSG